MARGRGPYVSEQREAAVGVGGAHSTGWTCRTTQPAGREGALVRGATRRVKGREIGVSLTTPPKLRRLQEALYTKAKQEPAYRFYLLYDKVCRADILAHAYALSRQHRGAPGVDGVTFEDIEGAGTEPWLAAVQEALRTQTYRPQPVRRVLIPKAGGGERPLGLLTIRDRVVQTAALLILQPIFEADLEPTAYGYRPGRTALEAVQEVHRALCAGHTEVIDGDVSQYFDAIPHADLMKSLARRISDRKVLRLLKMWLKAPVAEPAAGGGWRFSGGKRATRGTPQGGVMTPPTQSQTLPGSGSCLTSGSCIEKIDGDDIGNSTLMTHERSATCTSGPVCGTRESGARPVTAVSTRGGSAHPRPTVSRLDSPGPAVCGSGPAACRGITGAGGDGGVHREASDQPCATAPGARAEHGRESQLARGARPRRLAASGAAETRRWRIDGSSTTTCLTAWAVSG